MRPPAFSRRVSTTFGLLAAAWVVLAGATGSGVALAAPPELEGDTFTVFERPAVTRFPDVAYAPDAGAFLVVSGQQGVTGRFVTASGVDGPLPSPSFDGEPFEVTGEPMAYSPRVAGVGDAFVVCWLVEGAYSVHCRTVARGASPSLGPEQVLTTGTVAHLESAPSLACSRAASECLVTWVDGPDLALRGRRIGFNAVTAGPVIDIAVHDGVFEAFPAVACDEAAGAYLVVHTREPSSQPMAIAGQRVEVGSGALLGASTELYASTGLNNYPEVAHDAATGEYLAVSWLHEGNADVGGRFVSADGSPIGERFLVAGTRGFEGGDGIGLTFDAGSKTYLAVFQGPETPGEAQQAWAAPVGPDHLPGTSFQVTSGAVAKGVYQPRVASDQAGRFLVVTVVDYQRIDGQFVVAEVPASAASGSGAGGAGGEAGASGGSSAAGGGDDLAPIAGDDGGCGCRHAHGRPGWLAALLFSVVTALPWARRRRRLGQSPGSSGGPATAQ